MPPGQRDLWLLLAAIAVGHLVPGPAVRREVAALALEATGGAWGEREALSRMGATIDRAERAARGERVEHQGRLVDPRCRFKTATIVDLLGISEGEMRTLDLRHLVTPEIARERHRLAEGRRRRAAGVEPREAYEQRSLALLEPWTAEGVSRRTWYRRRRGTSPCRRMVAKP